MLLRLTPATDPILADEPPTLHGVGPWFNVPGGAAVQLDRLLGTVVLVDFWTYVCGNCTRSLPLLTELHDRYGRDDLVIVGVHTPEVAVDRRPANVATAVRQLGIGYPVGMDNDFAAWNRWGVEAWPTLFLVDRAGHVRRRHVGEGGTRATRRAVERLVAERPDLGLVNERHASRPAAAR
jgi:thiol-disulfide isomerase/thioredoxin